jgi:hypothetical protein
MIKKHISMSNAERCRQYRKRLKAKNQAKDSIEKALDNRVKSAKKEQKTKEIIENKEKKPIDFDSLDAGWLEPQDKLREQYQNESLTQYDFWGRKEGIENPLDSVSHAQNLRNMFGKSHAE